MGPEDESPLGGRALRVLLVRVSLVTVVLVALYLWANPEVAAHCPFFTCGP